MLRERRVFGPQRFWHGDKQEIIIAVLADDHISRVSLLEGRSSLQINLEQFVGISRIETRFIYERGRKRTKPDRRNFLAPKRTCRSEIRIVRKIIQIPAGCNRLENLDNQMRSRKFFKGLRACKIVLNRREPLA